MKEKAPLYRRETRGSYRNHHLKETIHYRYVRHKKRGKKTTMKHAPDSGTNLDYTPLYRFLQSKVGKDWDAIYSEAVSRLPAEYPIWHIVKKDIEVVEGIAQHKNQKGEEVWAIIGIGESAYFHALYIDENNLLQVKNEVLLDMVAELCLEYHLQTNKKKGNK